MHVCHFKCTFPNTHNRQKFRQAGIYGFQFLAAVICLDNVQKNMETLCSIYNFNLIAVINQKSELLLGLEVVSHFLYTLTDWDVK